MVVYRSLKDIKPASGTVLTIGTFDGLHRGHQEVVKRVVATSKARNTDSILVTFDPHPRHILDKKHHLPLLLGIDKKLGLIEELKIDATLVISFTREFSKHTAKEFLDDVIVNYFQPAHIIIGYDHHFGHNREGSPDFLKDYGKKNKIEVEVVGPVHDQDVVISSTHIRELISNGYVRRGSFELGWVYGFRAVVVHGAGRGKSLHFPTANFTSVEKNQLLPSKGVYFTRGRINGDNLYGMCNLGVRPTFGETDFVMEVHFFKEDVGDIYDQEITIEFLERLRDEKKFEDPDQLVKQLERDQKMCMQLMKKYN